MEFSEAWLKAIPIVQMCVADAELLFKHAKDKEFIVEVGTLKGGSAIVLGATGNKVWTIDNSPVNKEVATKVLAEFPNVELIEADSIEAGRAWKFLIDMLFIDGNHDYEAVRKDIDVWIDKVVSKGIIAFDDYESWPGVTQAVDESIARGELRKVEQAKSLLITEKT